MAALDKKERGSSSSISGKVGANEVKIIRWKDDAVVTVSSTLHGKNPTGKVKRWSRKDKKHTMINIPYAVQT